MTSSGTETETTSDEAWSEHTPGRRQTLVLLLRDAAQQLVDELVERLADAGYVDIRPSYSQVFENLDPEGTRLTVLARRARMTHPSMVELVSRIERLGYVERQLDPTDRRARMVRLTPRGRELQRIAIRELAAIERRWLEELGPELARELPGALADVSHRDQEGDTQATTSEN